MTKNNIRPAAESADYTASCYRDILAKIGVVLSFTKGVSMRPLIWQGRQYVAIVPVEEPQIDDILLFEQMRRGETACILHRLIKIETAPDSNPIYVTRGDNCLGCERIRREDIIGRVTQIYRRKSDRYISVTDKGYLYYVAFWNAIWPLRRIIYKARAVAARVYHFVKL